MTTTANPFAIAAGLYGQPDPFATPYDVQRLTDPEAKNPPHLQKLDELWQAIDRGEEQFVIVSLAPQEGKSERLVRAGVKWWFRKHLEHKLIVASFEKDTAARWGRAIRNDFIVHPQLGVRIKRDSAAADRWDIEGHRGGLYCVGVEGAITGRPADGIVIDDPVKGRADVESAAYREAQWQWWLNDVSTRLTPRSFVLCIQTRWHEDDLSGRLANSRRGFTVVNIPALAHEGRIDPLGREPGEALQSVQGKTREFYEDRRLELGPYVFDSLYQGDPTPAAGGLFKRSDLRYWSFTEPARVVDGPTVMTDRPYLVQEMFRFATVDLAASVRTSSDWTVASMWGLTAAGQLLLLDRVRARVEDTEHARVILPLVQRWKPEWVGVEDSSRAINATAGLTAAGVSVRALKPDTDKVTRALPAAAKVSRQEVWLPADVPWLDEFLGELVSFPNGKHDDQVDTLAYAARELVVAGTARAVFDERHDPYDHDDEPGVDFESMPF